MNYLRSHYWDVMSCPAILGKISLQLLFVAFMSLSGFTQTKEKTNENPVTNQNEVTVIHSESTNVVMSDSLKHVEAKRLYMTPVGTLKENKENGNSNPSLTIPKDK